MKLLEAGELVEIDGNKEYIVLKEKTIDGVSYLYLISNAKPIDIKFAKQTLVDNQIQISFIGNQEEKIKVLQEFSR